MSLKFLRNQKKVIFFNNQTIILKNIKNIILKILKINSGLLMLCAEFGYENNWIVV